MPLEYDDSAFYYFATSFVVVVLLPTAYSLCKTLYRAFINPEGGSVGPPRAAPEADKVARLKARNKPAHQFTGWFFLRLAIVAGCLISLGSLVSALSNDAVLTSWDPFEELGLESDATRSQINKAYRELSLLYHPDKDQSENAAYRFLKVSQAKLILTDEVAKNNWAKYGNPDGRKAMEVGIGLPTWLLESDKQKIVLLLYLVGLVVVVPAVVVTYYNKSRKYGHKHIMHKTWMAMAQTMGANSTARSLPETLSAALEFREIPLRPGNAEELEKLEKEFTRETAKDRQWKKPRFAGKNPFIRRGNLLLHAHMLQMDLSEELMGDLHKMLSLSPRLVDAMLEFSQNPPTQQGQRSRAWAQTMMAAVEMQQMLVQGMYAKDSSLLQLPYFTAAEVRHCSVGRNSTRTLSQFVRCDPENRKGMHNFTEEQVADVNRVCTIVPDLDVDVRVGVEDEEGIGAGDILTAFVKFTRRNVPEGGKAEPVYAPKFPEVLREKWYIFLTFTPQGQVDPILLAFKEVDDQEREFEAKVKFGGPPQEGRFKFDIHIKSNAYRGLDIDRNISIDVQPKEAVPEIEGHPVDSDDEEPGGGLYGMSGMHNDTDSDSSDEDEDEDEDEAPAAQLTDLQRRKKAAASGSGSAPASASADKEFEFGLEDSDDEDTKKDK